MYVSPIEKIYGELQTQMVQEDENMVMKAVREVGITVDKEELIKALQHDRNQYTKGYEDGKSDTLNKIRSEIEQLPTNYIEVQRPHSIVERDVVELGLVMQIFDKYKESEE